MKKNLLTAVGILACGTVLAQLPVSTSPQNKKVVLEEFTGVNCVWCPDGHKMANELQASKPAGDVILINIHTGSFANPGSGQPDYRTPEGAAIASIPGMGITGFPTGSINRVTFPGKNAMALNRGEWGTRANEILSQPSYVNLALEATLDVSTRLLSVDVEAYYTDNSPVPTNKITVALLEDNVFGHQTGGLDLYPAMMEGGLYRHMHMLRKIITSTLGDDISTTTQGYTFSQNYTYTIPAAYNNIEPMLGNLRLVAFIAESSADIVTAAIGPIELVGFNSNKNLSANKITADRVVCMGNATATIGIVNEGSETVNSAVITYNINGGTDVTYNYSGGSIAPFTEQNIEITGISFTPDPSNVLNVTITDVNGSANENTTNNSISSDPILLTDKTAGGEIVTMHFTQDRYGAESSWKVIDEANNNTVVAEGGPYSNLSANGTVVHTKQFNVNPSSCYIVEVYDEYGDGINSGAGAGGYELTWGTTTILSSNGKFGKFDKQAFKTIDQLVSVKNIESLKNIQLYPNPTTDKIILEFSLSSQETVTIQITDALGRIVSTIQPTATIGNNKVEINTVNFAAALYNLQITTNEGSVNHRFTVVK